MRNCGLEECSCVVGRGWLGRGTEQPTGDEMGSRAGLGMHALGRQGTKRRAAGLARGERAPRQRCMHLLSGGASNKGRVHWMGEEGGPGGAQKRALGGTQWMDRGSVRQRHSRWVGKWIGWGEKRDAMRAARMGSGHTMRCLALQRLIRSYDQKQTRAWEVWGRWLGLTAGCVWLGQPIKGGWRVGRGCGRAKSYGEEGAQEKRRACITIAGIRGGVQMKRVVRGWR